MDWGSVRRYRQVGLKNAARVAGDLIQGFSVDYVSYTKVFYRICFSVHYLPFKVFNFYRVFLNENVIRQNELRVVKKKRINQSQFFCFSYRLMARGCFL